MKTTRQKMIERHIDSFPVLPVTVMKLIKVTSDPESSVQDVLAVITPDQSLCLTVLKFANSVLFGHPKRVDSLQLAVSILGFNEVQSIALAKALINSFSKLDPQQKLYIDKFWEHSFICGTIARVIAKDIQVSPDIAFMGGLIHDVGKLVMLETFAADYSTEAWMTTFSNEEMLHSELETFSFTHDQVGGQLLKKWLFPDNLITAVAYHHHPVEATEVKIIAHIIQLADLLTFYCCNQELLGDDDILTVVHRSLPEIDTGWQSIEKPLGNDAIIKWSDWLLDNYEQGSNLKDAFSA